MEDLEQALNEVLNDPEKMQQVFQLAQSMGLSPPGEASEAGQAESAGPDRQAALLSALKPYTHGQRREKLEKAFQVVRLVKLAKTAMNTPEK